MPSQSPARPPATGRPRHFTITLALAMVPVIVICLGAANAAPEQTVVAPNKHLIAGTNALRTGDYRAAVRLLERGLDADDLAPHHRAGSLANLCAALVKTDRPRAAISVCTESLRLQPSWQAHHNRALALLHLGEVDAARADIDAGARQAPHARHLALARRAAERVEEQQRSHQPTGDATLAAVPP